ncbi:MAG: SPOR domain-containing protein [Prevotella sp.]|nr:SPOR domain-containing protein [Prevotella sp.]
MKEIVRHIEILLLGNDCVIVPGFGGFVAQRLPAYYKEEEKLFFPPFRTIGFNPQLKMNDSLLVQSYADAHDMSYPDALLCVEKEVEELKKQLLEEGCLEMQGIGTLTLNADGNIVFEPFEAGVLTPEYYGLDSYEIDVLNHGVGETASVVSLSDNNALPFIEEGKRDRRFLHVKMSWVRNAAVACAIGFTFFMLPQMQTEGNDALRVNTGLLSRVMPKDVVNGSVSTVNGESGMQDRVGIQLPSMVKKNTEMLFLSQETTKPFYSIVLASHITIDNAIDFVRDLQAQGYADAKILSRESVKVIYGKYEDKDVAYRILRPLKAQDVNFTDAWVMQVK